MDIPEILPEIRWIWEGFHALSASRQRGFSGLQPLTMVDIITYIRHHLELRDSEEREDVLHYIQFMDQIFMAKVDEKAKTKPPTK